MIESHVPADGHEEERLRSAQVLAAAYEKLRLETFTGTYFEGLSEETKKKILHDVFADAWAQWKSLTDVETTTERLAVELYDRAGRNRKWKRDKNEYVTSSDQLFDHLSYKAFTANTSDDEALNTPVVREFTDEEICELWETVRKVLKGRQLTVTELTYGQKLTPKQIGERLGMTAGAVRQHMKRARTNLENAKEQFDRFRSPPKAVEPEEGDTK
ncbi:sigma-70 family RNA polymerase sigma factor [Streptomyces sp. NPDC002935]|uniref:sigma-70 family RNA polymerase sigma factor n=1 Tax=Streptomyces sp. NPDC002935 TaxID=3154545 RepID=UPI00339E6D1B